MNRRELRRFKKTLQEIHAELGYALQNSLDRLVIAQSADPWDQIRSLTEQDVDSRNINLLMARLHRIEDALRSIQKGTFGRCIQCRRPISLERLQAVPWSPFCLACLETSAAQEAERNEPGRGAPAVILER